MGNMMMTSNGFLFQWITTEAIIFLTFVFVCAMLAKSRFTAQKTAGIILSGAVLSAAFTAAVFLGSHDLLYTFGLLSLTAYLPAILVLHLLSDNRFFGTVSIWCIGLLGMYIVRLSTKITNPLSGNLGLAYHAINILLPLAAMSVICIVTGRYIRRPFRQYTLCSDVHWTLPLMLLLLMTAMFSYSSNSTHSYIILLMLLLIAITIFFVIAKLLQAEYNRQEFKKKQEAYEARIRMQQDKYMEITHKHEALREYRHDMRHHLLVLNNILQDSDNAHAKEYINTLVERLENTENVMYCKNPIINAVLSSYIAKAKKIGCILNTHISIPEQMDIQDMDLCIVLANALENAVHACEKEAENRRYIKIKMDFQNALHLSIKNSCTKKVAFDKNGLPTTASKQEHGLGMKSIVKTIEKYNGILKCECSGSEFSLKAVLFHISEEKNKLYTVSPQKRSIAGVLFSLIGICVFLNVSPTIAEALADIPMVGPVVQVITAKQYKSGWGQSKFSAMEPKVILELPVPAQENLSENAETEVLSSAAAVLAAASVNPPKTPDVDTLPAPSAAQSADIASISSTEPAGSDAPAPGTLTASAAPEISPTTPEQAQASVIQKITEETEGGEGTENNEKNPALEEGVEEINDKMSEYIEALRQKYNWYRDRKYMGYVALESTYTILWNNDDMLSIRFDSTLNVGGSVTYSRCFTLDKRTGNVLELADLFQKDTDYITPISGYILEEMIRRTENNEGRYFIPGGMWPDDVCFKSIAKDQNFYINEENKLVIVFDEYEVAPGSMGVVEFVIPTDVTHAILAEPSLIQ